jgi:sulfopyruvate decarboxylase TPP-binding subunit
MLTGAVVVPAIEQAGFTHVIWIPDSHFGTWDDHLSSSKKLMLIRATREGEAVALGAGLLIGEAKPLVVIQCTGFFEAGDAVRNVVHDLRMPLKIIVGVRSWRASQQGKSADNCPSFAEPLIQAWKLPYRWFDPFTSTEPDCAKLFEELAQSSEAHAVLWGE